MSTVAQSNTKLPSLLSLVLVAILGVLSAKLMWLIFTPKAQTSVQVQAASSDTIQPKKKVNYGKLIANQHLFGMVAVKKKPVEAAPVKQAEPTAPPPAKLNLKLHGIVSYKSKRGFGLISSGSEPQKVYGVGDTIEEGVTVTEVHSDKVVLDNRGNAEELLLPVNEKRGGSTAPGLNQRAPNNSARQMPTNNPEPAIPRQQAPRLSLNLSKFRQEVLSSGPSKLLEIAHPTPAFANGKFIGFRLQPGRKRKYFRKLGFRPNDILTEVNGIILDDASKGPMVLNELTQASEVSIKIMRSGQEIFIQHVFE